MKKIVSYVFILAFLISFAAAGVTYAGNEQQQLNNLNQDISKTKSELNAGKKKEKDLGGQIRNLEKQINATETQIENIKADIGETMQQIDTTKQNLAKVEQEMATQNDDLQQRLRAMYKNGDVGMIQILLGSENITDFMSNMDMVQKIFDNDVQILKTMEEQRNKIEAQKKELESLQAQLESKQKQQADKQSSLQVSRGKVESLKAEVVSDNAALEAEIDNLNAEANRLKAEILKLQGNQAYIGGKLGWPSDTSYKVTSEFGYRIHPILKIKKFHTGFDIGAPSGSNVIASNDGTVIKSGWNNSYGYVVMVDHGGGIVTLYAHNSKLLVKVGDVVSRGQTIALVGATGDATGPNIHFEVRVNGEYKNPRDWV